MLLEIFQIQHAFAFESSFGCCMFRNCFLLPNFHSPHILLYDVIWGCLKKLKKPGSSGTPLLHTSLLPTRKSLEYLQCNFSSQKVSCISFLSAPPSSAYCNLASDSTAALKALWLRFPPISMLTNSTDITIILSIGL